MRFLLPLFLLVFLGVARAAPLERDLGGGLRYYRVTNLPADLPAAPAGLRKACVLDLRYAQGDVGAVDALNLWLKSRATPRAPVLVLANAKTSAVVLASLRNHVAADGIILLGAEGAGFTPDIALKVSPEVEQSAYDALPTRPDTDWLLKENVSKVRNDEARLSKEHLSDSSFEAALPPLSDESSSGEKEKAPAIKEPPPLIDVVLQRAVHLHRALLGLKKIQP